MTPRALCIDTDREHGRLTRTALMGLGYVVDVTRDISEARDKISTGSYDMCVSGVGTPVERCALASEAIGDSGGLPIVIVGEDPRAFVAAACSGDSKQIPHLLARNGRPNNGELIAAVVKHRSKRIFGLGPYFPRGVRFRRVLVTDSRKRGDTVEMITNSVVESGGGNRLAERVGVVLEEFLMNAIYDAPTTCPEGTPRFAHISRTEKVELEPHEAAVIRYGTDGFLFGVSVRDPFGALEAKTVSKYLSKYSQRGEAPIDDKEGGAGLGMVKVLRACDALVINVHKQVATECISLFHLDRSHRALRRVVKTFEFFYQE